MHVRNVAELAPWCSAPEHRHPRPATVSELAGLLGVTVAATVQHLQVLEGSELVRSEKSGRVRTCRIDTTGLRSAEAWLHRQRTTWERRLDRLGDALGEPPHEEPPHQEPPHRKSSHQKSSHQNKSEQEHD